MKNTLRFGLIIIGAVSVFLSLLVFVPVSFADTDVTDTIEVVKSRLRYNLIEQCSFLDVSLKNISEEALGTPLRAVISNITDPDVTVANADGTTEDGEPCFEYSTELSPGGTSAARTWKFANPLRKRFDYDVTIIVPADTPQPSLSVGVSYPSEGEAIYRPYITVRGTVTDTSGKETVVMVNGVFATVYDNEFVANHVPLQEGENIITAVATDADGNTAETSVSVSAVATEDYIRLIPVREAGVPTLRTEVRIYGASGFSESSLTCTDPDVGITKISEEQYEIEISTEGLCYLTAQATGTQNKTYTDTAAIIVMSEKEILSLLSEKFNQMIEAAKAGDIETALGYFTPAGRERHKEYFENFTSNDIGTIFSDIVGIHLEAFYKGMAKCGIVRMEDGEYYSYPVTFVADEAGIWKIAQL